ncbi:hypothetical protein QYF61_013189 [Mycteria americana]|uniref:Uncharacterized protein n=1 Tax=Mycteria americana TaxID=33587 RepID=A0AAN7NUJ6_MYCAM|nr:hypothetical protein QYF61_013189 [Mycteria americana]
MNIYSMNLEPVAQHHIQMAFEVLQGKRLYHFPGQPMPVLVLGTQLLKLSLRKPHRMVAPWGRDIPMGSHGRASQQDPAHRPARSRAAEEHWCPALGIRLLTADGDGLRPGQDMGPQVCLAQQGPRPAKAGLWGAGDQLCYGIAGAGDNRIVEVGRDLWSSSAPNLLLKQGYLRPAAHHHVQTAFEYLQGWRLHNLSGKPVPMKCNDSKREKQKTKRKGREGKGREGKGREGKGREGKGREGKGREGKGREGKGREGKGREGKGREGKGREGKGREGKGREGKGREGKGREGKGREGKGREGKGRERKGKPFSSYSLVGWSEKQKRPSLYGWRLNHFPGQPLPMLDNPFSEEKFPNSQSKPPLVQLEAIVSCPITCYLGEETDPHLSTTSFQWGTQKLNTGFEVRPHQCQGQEHDRFPRPAGHTIFDTSQDAIGFLGHLGTLLAHIQAAVNQHAQVLFCQAAFQPLFPKPVALHGVAVAQVQDPALSLVEPHTIGPSPSIQPVQVPLQSLPTLKQINTPAQFGVICKLPEGALDPFVQIIDKDIKQNWPQHRALGNTACDRPPTGVNSIHHHSLGLAIQPVLYPGQSTHLQAMSSQFLQENAVGNHVKGFTEV